jgi:hypothetical protein
VGIAVTTSPAGASRRRLSRQRRQVGQDRDRLLARLRARDHLHPALQLVELEPPRRGVALEFLEQQLAV